jgi:hypothetical protein
VKFNTGNIYTLSVFPCVPDGWRPLRSMKNSYASVVDGLLQSDEPSIRWKVRVGALGEDPDSKAIRRLRQEVRASARARTLLAHRDAVGRITSGRGVYAKWQGAHWILASLADLGYPARDKSLLPVREQILDAWLSQEFYEEFEATSKSDAYTRRGVPVMHGRHRRCASQQGYALFFLIRLGLEDQRLHDLVERLLHWQWPDGGWNCDKEPSAAKSTFIHTIHSMRGLHVYGTRFGKPLALAAAEKASRVFLSRRLFKRKSDGKPMKLEFTKLHYPLYWHYDLLLGLQVMAETGHLADPRCADALDLLESKQLADGGWPAESRYYSVSKTIKLNADHVSWGGVSKKTMNPWVTANALSVLKSAGRL